jgi:vacuolar-type H+-ATPase subunit H
MGSPRRAARSPEAAHVNTTDTVRVDEAIVRVLQAEQAARDAVAQCAIDAERLRQEARARAKAIAERAALRVAHVHERTDAALHATVERLNAERAALQRPAAPDPDEPARVARALDWLAAELTGGLE